MPTQLPVNQIAIRGHYSYDLDFKIENFYIPENSRLFIEAELSKNPETVRVEVKVDSSGNAALNKLIIGYKTYNY